MLVSTAQPSSYSCPSTIVRVVVHARGALVTRRALVPTELPPGGADLVISEITPLAEPGSVRAALPGSARQVVSLHTSLVVPSTPALVGASVERVRALEQHLARLSAEETRLSEQVEALRQLHPTPTLGTLSRSAQAGDRFADALAAATLADEILAEIDARLGELAIERRRVEEERDAAALAAVQASSAERMGQGHPTRRIVVRTLGEGPVEALEVTYVVPAARWWPLYALRLTEGGRSATWHLEALVAQLSGEDWRGALLGLSTSDLVHDARLPELPSLRLGRAQPTARRGYRPPPPGLEQMFASYDRALPALSLPEPPPLLGGAVTVGQALSRDDEVTMQWRGDVSAEMDLRTFSAAGVAPDQPRDITREVFSDDAGADQDEEGALLERESIPEGIGAPPAPPAFGAPAAQSLPPMTAAPVTAAKLRSRGGVPRAAARVSAPGGGGGPAKELRRGEPTPTGNVRPGPARPGEPTADIEPADAWLDFDTLALAPVGDRVHRGRLVRQETGGAAGARGQAQMAIEGIAPPAPVRDPQVTRGVFDHRYEAAGLVEVPSDGRPHRVTLGSAPAEPTLLFRSVPREVAAVYREAELKNPFDAPLLAGPVDVYVDGSLLGVTQIEQVDRGGLVRVGLGVEERIRVARNTRTSEDSAGLLGGSTVVEHEISIDLVSSLGREARIEVLERMPVTDEKALHVELLSARPAGEPSEPAKPYDQADRGAPVRGGLRWRVTLPPGGKTTLVLRYRLTLPSKNEIVGGNRRE
ncbi:MAG TPA: DUF4139 domain-containing protein [Polyangia bacterium]|nr:DUF4139 domain-containing protein [Polyangia bacterium]